MQLVRLYVTLSIQVVYFCGHWSFFGVCGFTLFSISRHTIICEIRRTPLRYFISEPSGIVTGERVSEWLSFWCRTCRVICTRSFFLHHNLWSRVHEGKDFNIRLRNLYHHHQVAFAQIRALTNVIVALSDDGADFVRQFRQMSGERLNPPRTYLDRSNQHVAYSI